MLWQLQFFPACTHHVFLSHCREDREWLVFPLFQALQQEKIIPVDRHDYPYGRNSFGALRMGSWKSRHTVFLVTRAMLCAAAWLGIIETVWAESCRRILASLAACFKTSFFPCFSFHKTICQLLRSAWQPIRECACFYAP